MRTAVLVLMKLATAGLLAAALFDVKIPGGMRPRMRVYLMDLSASTSVAGAPESITPTDAWRLAAADARRFDEVVVLGIGAEARVLYSGSPDRFPVDPPDEPRAQETDIAAALETALLRIAAERDADIVVMSDGRSTRGDVRRALLACAARGVPVHTLAIGPLRAADARIVRIEGPSLVDPKEPFELSVEVESSRDGTVEIALEGTGGRRAVTVTLVREVPRLVRFDLPASGARADFTAMVRPLDHPDACPANDSARWTVLPRSDSRKVLVLSQRPSAAAAVLRAQSSLSVTESTSFRDPFEFDAVVLDDVAARRISPEDQARLREFVSSFGGGLVMLGGPESFGPGGWSATPAEEVLPVWAFPDETLALVFVLDRSGTMNQELPGLKRSKIDAARQAILNVLDELRPRDLATVVAFPPVAPDVWALAPLRADRAPLRAALKPLDAGGPTELVRPLREAVKLLSDATAPRRHVFLVTDGVTAEGESAAMFDSVRAEFDLRRIGLTFLLTGDRPSDAAKRLGTPVPVTQWEKLSEILGRLVAESLDPVVTAKGALRPVGTHRETEGIASWPRPARINRVSTKPGAALALACDDHPVLAMRAAGRGRTAAVTLSLAGEWAGELDRWSDLSRLLTQVVLGATPGESGLYRLAASASDSDVLVSATGPESGPAELLVDSQSYPGGRTGEIRLSRTSRTGWEGRATPPPGTTYFRLRDARGGTAIFHLPYPPEYRRLGPDADALAAMSGATGGTVVRRPADLAAGPPRGRIRRSGRAAFLAAALVLFLLDLAISTFWVKRK
ncbi:MAG: VWA domain-containing protein [Planctomycetes bacterium]|nr:VWA domain-containing protein [Planctomycetota bacterium]